jgi:hypothetical protein
MTLGEFIAALGGPSAAGEVFGVGRTAVQNWLAAGRLPDRYHLRAVRESQQRGLAFDPEVRSCAA